MGEPLRRHRAARALVGRARAVFERELLAIEHRGGDVAERGLVQLAGAVRDHAHALDRHAAAAGVLVEQLLDAVLQRRQRVRQHAAAAAQQQLLRGQQRVQLVRTQPQARQLEALALAVVVAESGLAVADHRRHQVVAQVGEVAVDGRARAFELLLQALHRHRVARTGEDAVQGVDAFDAFHGCRRLAAHGAGWSEGRAGRPVRSEHVTALSMASASLSAATSGGRRRRKDGMEPMRRIDVWQPARAALAGGRQAVGDGQLAGT